jgi:hypothetical protein
MRLPFILGFAMAALACGRAGLDDGAGAGEAGGGVVAGAAGVTGAAGASGAAGGTVMGVCTPGADQTCNDELSVSALWGHCVDGGAGGACECHDGFSINPKTGRCRFGNLCVASGADDWPVTVMVDHADCGSRKVSSCSGMGMPDGLYDQILTVAEATCALPPFIYLRIELTSGCATLLQVRGDGSAPDPKLVQCLAKTLTTWRWSCADPSACSLIEWEPVGPIP